MCVALEIISPPGLGPVSFLGKVPSGSRSFALYSAFCKVFKLPPRSPSLMPLDASFWNRVEKQMDEADDGPGPGCPPPPPPALSSRLRAGVAARRVVDGPLKAGRFSQVGCGSRSLLPRRGSASRSRLGRSAFTERSTARAARTSAKSAASWATGTQGRGWGAGIHSSRGRRRCIQTKGVGMCVRGPGCFLLACLRP